MSTHASQAFSIAHCTDSEDLLICVFLKCFSIVPSLCKMMMNADLLTLLSYNSSGIDDGSVTAFAAYYFKVTCDLPTLASSSFYG